MAEIPKTQYAETNVGRIAYQIVGDGPVDVLVNHPPNFPIDLMWDEPHLAGFLNGLSGFCRHIWFDPRGRGASDPLPPGSPLFQETVVEDMIGLLDALHLDQVAILGMAGGVLPLFAAGHPERTTAAILLNVFSGFLHPDADARNPPAARVEQVLSWHRANWGNEDQEYLGAPGLAHDPRYREWQARAQRLTCTADEACWRLLSMLSVDYRDVVGAIKVPTLVIVRAKNPLVGANARPDLAKHIPDAEFVELDGEDYLFFAGEFGPLLDAIEEFLTGELPTHASDRILATVMFTDIVGSTDRLARVGDRTWKATLTAHDALVSREIDRHRGRQINTTGDGVLATFDGPGRAVRCAQAIVESVRSLGIEVRAGVHTGEIELRGDDIGGIGVHIAARVASLAGAGEVLVSRTVTDLVAGSGIEFEDRGERELKGIPGGWRVYSVVV